MHVAIRDATPADAAAVADLLAEVSFQTSAEAAAAHVARFADDHASRLQVAVTGDDEVAVGLVATHIVPRLDDDALSCGITDLVVSGAHRRSGIGSALMAAAEEHARAAGAPAAGPV